MGLFERFRQTKAESRPSATPPTERLDEDGELPWGWYGRHLDDFKDFESTLVSLATFAKDANNKVDERIATYEALIEYYDKGKFYFLNLSECHAKYFTNTWMHLFNSRCDDFEYVDMRKEELAELRERYDDLKKRELLLPTLDDDLLRFVKEHGPVRQTDVYKAFDQVVKLDVQDKLYHLGKEGVIRREKEGRTYTVTIVE